MSLTKSYHDLAIPCALVKFESFKVLSCQFGAFCQSLQSIWINLDVKYHSPLRTYYCNCSTSLPRQDGQSCVIDRRTSQFRNFRLCWIIQLCDVSSWKLVCPHWAGSMFWWMAKHLMTNDTYDSRAAGLLNHAVQIKSPWRWMSTIIPSNRILGAYIHGSPPSIEDDLKNKGAQITKNDTFIFGRDHNFYQQGVLWEWIRHGSRD